MLRTRGPCVLVLWSIWTVAACERISPCELVSELIQMSLFTSDKEEFVDCNHEDIARLVCTASLHDFDTSYSYHSNIGNYGGIFGVERNATTADNPKVERKNVTEMYYEFTSYQFRSKIRLLNGKNSKRGTRIISEIICDDTRMDPVDYRDVLDAWNLPQNSTGYEEYFAKKKVNCSNISIAKALSHPSLEPTPNMLSLNDESLIVWVANEKLRRIYRPGTLPTKNDDALTDQKTTCKPFGYCMNFPCFDLTSPDDDASQRDPSSRLEWKIRAFVKVVDWTIIVVWLLCVFGASVAGYLYLRNPRRRGDRRDDWSRPILYAQFTQ